MAAVFDRIILTFIVLNMILIMLKYYQSPPILDTIIEQMNTAFAGIFILEAIIKLTGLGKRYFKDGWNNFDFFIVLSSIASILISGFTTYNLGGKTIIIRAMRIGRIIRLIKKAKFLNLVFSTLVHTLPAMANIGGLLFLLIYIYSIIGIQIFSQVMRNGSMTEQLNFESFANAFISLLACATGDATSPLMQGTIRIHSIDYQCVQYPTY